MASAQDAAFHLRPELITVLPAVFVCLTIIAVSLRLYVRGFILRTIGIDDWLLILAWCLFVVDCCCWISVGVLQRTQGLLKPLDELIELTLAGISVYLIGQAVLKLSFATFFLRFTQQRLQRWIIIITVSIYVVYNIMFMFVVLFYCGNPTPWTFITHTHCVSWDHVVSPLNYIASILNAVTDWVFVGVTVLFITQTLTKYDERASVGAILCLGALGSVISVVRIPFIHELRPTLGYFSKIAKIEMISLSETCIGIIAISVVTLRPLVRLCMEKIGNSDASQHSTRTRQPSLGELQPSGSPRHSVEMASRTSSSKTDSKNDRVQFIEASVSCKGSVSPDSIHDAV